MFAVRRACQRTCRPPLGLHNKKLIAIESSASRCQLLFAQSQHLHYKRNDSAERRRPEAFAHVWYLGGRNEQEDRSRIDEAPDARDTRCGRSWVANASPRRCDRARPASGSCRRGLSVGSPHSSRLPRPRVSRRRCSRGAASRPCLRSVSVPCGR